MPIELTGVVRGRTITLDADTFLPDGYRVTLHVALTKKRMEKAIDARRRTWDADVISVPAARS